jgi:GTPase SAR1 family protein
MRNPPLLILLLLPGVKELRKQTSGDVILTIAANKCDLAPNTPFDEAESFAASLGARLFQTSAKSDLNVTECFAHIAELLPKKKPKKANKDTVDLLGNNKPKEPCPC